MPNPPADAREPRFAQITLKVFTTLWPAVKSAWLYSLIGLLAGFGFLLLHAWLVGLHHAEPGEEPAVWLKLVEHLGLGFIVAAIAVFFYEWGAHIKETVHLAQQLVDIIGKDVAPLATLTGKAGLDSILQELIMRGNHESNEAANISRNTIELVDAVSSLQNAESWGSRQYLGVVAYQLQGVVANANALRNVVVTGRGEHSFKVAREAEEIADVILAAQMDAMENGDRYDVITSIPTWRPHQLKIFTESTRRAIMDRGVRVRRLFNLLRYPSQQSSLSEVEIRTILKTELDRMGWSTTNGYDAKIIGDEECALLGIEMTDRLRGAHFGVFRHFRGPRVEHVRFWVDQADLSDMRMAKNANQTTTDLNWFETLWSYATPVTQDAIPALVERIKRKPMPSVPPPP